MDLRIKKHVDYLSKCFKNKEPLAKVFKTESSGYIYDTGTGKVLQCEVPEFTILEGLIYGELESSISTMVDEVGEERLLDALVNIKNSIENENILKSEKTGEFYSPNHFEFLEENIKTGLEQIAIEVTEQCNLRCEYCIYNDEFEGMRLHGSKEMSEETAKLAIDYIAKHGSEKGVAITFYGGEPLIKFPLIKECVEYSKQIIKDKPITYSLTSNMLLMTDEIAKFLAEVEDFSVVCSIDGPKHIHDNFRKDLNGNGSFERAIRGLKYLVEAFGDSAKDRILINSVYTPPYYQGRAEETDDFFNSLEWLPKEIQKLFSYPEGKSIPLNLIKEKYKEKNIDFETNHNGLDLKEWSDDKYVNYIRNNKKSNNSKQVYFSKDSLEKAMLKIHKRQIFNEPNGKYPLNGCCVPGVRKIYICTDGKFLICERIAGADPIGDVYSGVDINKIKNIFIDEYSSKTKEKCTKCWAVRLCDICYAQCYTNKNLDLDKRERECNIIRAQIEGDLRLYHRCMEVNSEGLEYLNDIQIS